MVIFEKKIRTKYTLKRTKLHRFKKISRGSMPPNSLAMRMGLSCDMQILKPEKNSCPPPYQVLGTPLQCMVNFVCSFDIQWNNGWERQFRSH